MMGLNPPMKMGAGFRFVEKTKIPQLPKSSGVYVFKKDREFLYIGKASNLKERVKNHFSQPAYRDGLFLDKVKKIGFIKTDSEIEALILEANLIKKYQPRHNIVWRDDKNYFYVGITKEDFPRIFITHQTKLKTEKEGARRRREGGGSGVVKLKINYLGPFVDGKSLKAVLKLLRKVFPFRTCKTLPKRPCLWYQLGRCPAPCLLKTKLGQQIPVALSQIKNEGQRNAKNLIEILQGKKKQVLKKLKKEMKEASDLQDYEKAAKIRDQIGALEKVLAHAKIFELEVPQKVDWPQIQKILQKVLKTKKGISRIEAYDISNIQGQEATGSLVTFIKGLPDKNFYRKFKIRITGKPDDIAMIKEVLSRRFGHPEWPYPDLILIDGGRGQLNAALTVLNQHKSVKSASISVLALAKKENKLYIENRKKPILLKSLPREIFNLILQLRDEAHRFAISYHKKLRAKALLK